MPDEYNGVDKRLRDAENKITSLEVRMLNAEVTTERITQLIEKSAKDTEDKMSSAINDIREANDSFRRTVSKVFWRVMTPILGLVGIGLLLLAAEQVAKRLR